MEPNVKSKKLYRTDKPNKINISIKICIFFPKIFIFKKENKNYNNKKKLHFFFCVNDQ